MMANLILEGDCLNQMRTIDRKSVDLIYLDPPFFTKRKHKLQNRERTKEFCFDDIWGSEEIYAEFLRERMMLMKEILKEDGTIFIHCDKNGQHIIRTLLDNVLFF